MSLLDEIRGRANQPTVAPRQDIFLQTNTDTSAREDSENLDRTQKPTQSSELKRLEDLLASFPEIAARVPVRLETSIKSDLDQLCNREKITIETLIEAFYTICQDKDPVMRKVIAEAQRRLKNRKEAGNIRSSLTKLKNLTKK